MSKIFKIKNKFNCTKYQFHFYFPLLLSDQIQRLYIFHTLIHSTEPHEKIKFNIKNGKLCDGKKKIYFFSVTSNFLFASTPGKFTITIEPIWRFTVYITRQLNSNASIYDIFIYIYINKKKKNRRNWTGSTDNGIATSEHRNIFPFFPNVKWWCKIHPLNIFIIQFIEIILSIKI